MPKEIESWKELKRAIKGKGIGDTVELSFFKPYEDDIISLVIEGIDNEYESSMDSVHNWEIYLKSDGTWEIR